MMLVWLAVGCGGGDCQPLVDVPVSSGSAAEAEEVRRVLDDVYALVSDGICLTGAARVERDDVEVAYRRGHRDLRWTDGFAALPVERRRTGLRHALCHAVDHQWALVDNTLLAWQGPWPEQDGPFKREHEVFALACEGLLGPGLGLLAPDTCEGSVLPEHAMSVRDGVWGGVQLDGRVNVGRPRVVSAPSGQRFSTADPSCLPDGRLLFDSGVALDPVDLEVELWPGVDAGADCAASLAVEVPYPFECSGCTFPDVWGGRALAAPRAWVDEQPVRRIVARDLDGVWRPVLDCLRPVESESEPPMFAWSGGQMWLLQPDGELLQVYEVTWAF